MPNVLHIVNGDIVRDGLARAGVPGTLAVWADALHDGPVPPLDVGPARWRAVRARHAADAGWVPYDVAERTLAAWDAALDRAAEHDEVVIWVEHDLFDQLLLARHLAALPQSLPLTLIEVGAWPGRPDFKGLGELSPAELASLLPTRRPVTPAQRAVGARAFAALAGDDPRALAALADDPAVAALPFLAPALRRLLEEYPATDSGLSRTEATLLAVLAERGPTTLAACWRALHARETAYYQTDLTLRALVARLGATPAVVTQAPAASGREWDATLAITDHGRAVLAGRADLLRTHPLDRWIGGVHLQGAAPAWRRDAATGRVVARG